MYPMEVRRTVKLIVDTCLDIKPGRKILILGYTEDDLLLAGELAAEAKTAGAEVGIVVVEPPRHVEPPEFLAAAMTKVDTVVTLGLVDFGHTKARKALTAAGINYAYIPDLMHQEINDLNVTPQDLLEIRDRTLLLAEMVSQAQTARLTSPAGTDLTLDLTGRPGLPLHPIFRPKPGGPGHFAIVPFYYEVACAPVEDRAQGVVVAEGTVVGLPGLNGLLREPIRWQVEAGRVVKIEGGPEARSLEDLLGQYGENANSIAELGVGGNYRMRRALAGNRRDNAIFGHVHLALGRNLDLGGQIYCPLHADFMTLEATLYLDGRKVIDQGRWVA